MSDSGRDASRQVHRSERRWQEYGDQVSRRGDVAGRGGRAVIEVARPNLWPTLRTLEQAGHTLIEIKPALSLETAFLRVVKGD